MSLFTIFSTQIIMNTRITKKNSINLCFPVKIRIQINIMKFSSQEDSRFKLHFESSPKNSNIYLFKIPVAPLCLHTSDESSTAL